MFICYRFTTSFSTNVPPIGSRWHLPGPAIAQPGEAAKHRAQGQTGCREHYADNKWQISQGQEAHGGSPTDVSGRQGQNRVPQDEDIKSK